jgi:hypothetical protein
MDLRKSSAIPIAKLVPSADDEDDEVESDSDASEVKKKRKRSSASRNKSTTAKGRKPVHVIRMEKVAVEVQEICITTENKTERDNKLSALVDKFDETACVALKSTTTSEMSIFKQPDNREFTTAYQKSTRSERSNYNSTFIINFILIEKI